MSHRGGPGIESFAVRLDRLRRQVQEMEQASQGPFEELRVGLESIRAGLESTGWRDLADVVERVGMLVDVWECLAADVPHSAQEMAQFCARALGALTQATTEGAPRVELDWILDESKARWAQYLGLPDEELSESDLDFIGDEPVFDDAPAAIDSANLLRLLLGSAAPEPSFLEPATVEPRTEPPIVPKPPSAVVPASSTAPPSTRPERRAESAIPQTLSMDAELREAFLAEAGDLFDRIETLVLDLGGLADQSQALQELGRCFHTLKGAAGSVGLIELSAMIHSLEESLDGSVDRATPAMIDQFFDGLKSLEDLLEVLRRGSPATLAPTTSVDLASAPASSARPPARELEAESTWSSVTAEPSVSPPSDGGNPQVESSCSPPSASPSSAVEGPLRVSSARIDDLMDLASELITRRGLWMSQADAMKEFAAQAKACRSRLVASIDRFHDLGLSCEWGASTPGSVPLARTSQADFPWFLRRLSEQAEDLSVLSETAQAASLALSDQRDAIARLTLQLWESLQAIRITPVRSLFQRLARVAHDAARVEGRQVEVVMAGEESGLDRAVQDKVFEPMLHMIRNAVGHGIESVADRARAGKPATGRVSLGARCEGSMLVLTVTDDGRGLDYAAIEAKGRRLGLIGPDEPVSRARLNAIVFQSGFSTREEANSISGRGVGMDVVSQEVARLHGTIDLASQPGLGTTLTLRLPVRLALEQVMIVRIDGQAFAIPVALVDLAQPFEPGEQDGRGAEATVQVRGRQLPLVDARDALGFSATLPASNPKLLLVRADTDVMALLVDAIDGTLELVLRPLGPLLAGHPMISGTGFSASGEAILALNPAGLFRWHRGGGLPSSVGPRRAVSRHAPVLVVDDSISVRKVVTRQIRTLGYQVEEVSHGLEALGRLRNSTYSMIFTDLEMPQLDGFELLAELGRSPFLKTLPVVVASTKCDPETQRRVMAMGARAFLSKPVELDTLARLIPSLLDGTGTTQDFSASADDSHVERPISLTEGTPWKAL